MFGCDIHPDGSRAAITGHSGTHVIDIATGQLLHAIPRGCFGAKFMKLSNRILYQGNRVRYSWERVSQLTRWSE